MFTSARNKLTLWYLAILMAISIIFSLVIYRIETGEAQRLLDRQVFQINNLRPGLSIVRNYQDVLDEAQDRLRFNLILINLGILVIAGGAAYFLAGKTLQPIEVMVEDQKRFLADASHELRTPLATMKTELEVNLRDKNLTKEAAKTLLDSNLEEVNKMSYLSNKLLHLNNYEQAQKFDFAKVNLQEILQEAVEKNMLAAKTKKIEFVLDLTPAFINGNQNALIEAFGTIIENSIKYSSPKQKINLSLKPQNANAIVKIQDFGLGIKAGDLPHIFDRFFRADSARSKEKIDGFGLGLSIAKIVFDRHDAKVEVQSTPDVGTTFTITFHKIS